MVEKGNLATTTDSRIKRVVVQEELQVDLQRQKDTTPQITSLLYASCENWCNIYSKYYIISCFTFNNIFSFCKKNKNFNKCAHQQIL